MKKIFLATAALFAGSLITANAGIYAGITPSETKKEMRREKREERKELWHHSVNMATERQFYMDFPNASYASWTEDAFAEVCFYDGDILKTAYYDTDNVLVGTTVDVDFAVLPDKARQLIAKDYPGYTVARTILFDDNEENDTDMQLFSSSFNDEDTYFIEMKKGTKEVILRVSKDGDLSLFRNY